MIEKLNRRTKKAIIHSLDMLTKKYGIDETRSVVNNYFTQIREKKKLDKEIQAREQELLKLKRKMGQ